MPLDYATIKARKAIDPEYAARLNGYAKAYVERNREKELERQRLVKQKKRAADREANNAYIREWNAKNKDRINEKRRERRKNDPVYREKQRERGRNKYKKSIDKHRNTMLKNKYGISLDEYQQMYSSQEGKCGICDTVRPNNGRGGLVVDHCHDKGHIRGLLCAKCNTGLGQFRDDTGLLQKAIDYLTRR